MARNQQQPHLARRIGLVETIAIALGAMIGAGVYVSIGEAAGITGGSAAGALLFILSSMLDLRLALEVSSLALLIYYVIMNLSALRLPQERRLYPLIVPAMGLIATALIAFSLPWQTLLVVLVVVIVGLVYFGLQRRIRT